jgi:signal transduction histidine kinase
MRVTVRTKVVAGLAVILGMGAVSMLIIYQGLGALREGMRQLADFKQPSSAAAYEMEINANGIALAVLKYLESAEPQYRRLVEDDMSDFERSYADYLRLSESGAEKALADSIGAAYSEFRGLAELLMDEEDEQETRFAEFGQGVERIDEIIDGRIQPRVDRRLPVGFEKVEVIADLEADIAEWAFWVANYRRAPRPEYRELIFTNYREFGRKLDTFKTLDLTAAERSAAAEMDDIRNRLLILTREILADDDLVRDQTQTLVALRAEIDRILDERIQVLAGQALREPRQDAEARAELILDTVRFLIPIFVLLAGVVALLLIKSITAPLRKLTQGTEAVRGGDLSYRIDLMGRDEFAELGSRFDEMVAKLQATTVSKELLEASEARLQETVAELRREIHERMEAEKEQARLQASLRRSETMSAMGALVAGVAHEVRNPLFGISSTLDAMDARFGELEQYQRYKQVVRGELERLNELMRELLEYGKPPVQILSAGSIAEVVAEAISTCAPLAQRTKIAIANRVPVSLAPVLMEHPRMLQVFRNLIENALQHTPPDGTVTLEAGEFDDDGHLWVECSVQDSGPGLEPEDLERIFEPFFSRRQGGTGLGLSIVRRFVEEHGGQVWAANGSSGAVITVRLPAARL